MEINTVVNIINNGKFNKSRTSNKVDFSLNEEKFSHKLEDSSKNSDTANNINDHQSMKRSEEINPKEVKKDKVSEDSSDVDNTKKVNELIIFLFQGKIDFNKFQEEINKITLDESQKKLLLDSALQMDNNETFVNPILQLLSNEKLTSKEDIIQKLKSMIQKFEEGIDENAKSSFNDDSIDTLLTNRFITTKKSSIESADISKKGEVKIDDILNSLTQKKSDKSDTAMLKLNGLFNSISNNSQSVEQASDVPLLINKNNLVDDIIKSVNFMNTNDIKELTVKINPKELGEIVIKLVVDGNNMKANIQATNKEAYNLLSSQTNELSKNLQDIKIQGVTINIYQEDTTFFAGQFNGQSQSREENNDRRNVSPSNKLNIDEVEEIGESTVDSNINVLA